MADIRDEILQNKLKYQSKENKLGDQVEENKLSGQAEPNVLKGTTPETTSKPGSTSIIVPTLVPRGGVSNVSMSEFSDEKQKGEQQKQAPSFERPRGIRGVGFNARRRAKKRFLDAAGYLTRIFKRSAIASLVSSLTGALSYVFGAVVGAVAGLIGAVTGFLAALTALAVIGVGGTLSAGAFVVIGLISAGIIAFLVIIFGACNIPYIDFIAKQLGLCPGGVVITVPKNPEGVTVSKQGPFKVDNGESIAYTIKVEYDPAIATTIPAEDLNVYDIPIFEYTIGSRTTPGYTPGTDASGRNYLWWDLGAISSVLNNGKYIYNFNLTVRPQQQDFKAINAVYVAQSFQEIRVEEPQTDTGGDPEALGPGTTSSGPQVLACDARTSDDIWYGADCAPNARTCNGTWTNQMDNTRDNVNDLVSKNIITRTNIVGTGYNFGDPKCSFNAARRGKIIREFEPNNEKRALFYEDIAKCEGTPNSFGAQDGPIGPAGHFQMNASRGRLFRQWDPTDPLKGDIPWQRQVQNAIRYNNNVQRPINNDFEFWGVARCLCYYPGYRNEPVCDDIRNGGRIRQPNATDPDTGVPLCSDCTRTQGPKGLGG